MDRQWWQQYGDDVLTTFKGGRYSTNEQPAKYLVTKLPPMMFNAHGNSGAGAIRMAADGGAQRIILVGYDCQKTAGKAHWHGDHPRGMGNAGQINKWPAKFDEMAKDLVGVEIINATRQTALTCWPCAPLESLI